MRRSEIATLMRRLGAPPRDPPDGLPATARACRICGAEWPREGWVLTVVSADEVLGYCCIAHCREGGHWNW